MVYELCVALFFAVRLEAATPAPEQLLPADTIAVVSVPDWDKAAQFYAQSPFGRVWQDSALKPFNDNLAKQFREDVVTPLENELGIKLDDFSNLVHGQVTFAVTQGSADGQAARTPGILLLIDAKDQGDRLKSQFSTLKKKWVDSGKQIKSEKIRDVEFTTLLVRHGDLSRMLEKAFPAPEPGEKAEKKDADGKDGQFEITLGQSESLLLVGNSPKELEKILIRQSGGALPPLAEQAAYEANHAAAFRDALLFGWVNFKPIYELMLREVNESAKSGAAENPLAPRPDKILSAIGLSGLKTVGFKVGGTPDGALVELSLGVPESDRQGIFKILAAEAKDSAPPPFVPADAVKFSRWRLDGQKMWATLEAMAAGISSEVANFLQMGLATIGKDKDPNFDLKKSLIGNLGDDFIVIEKNPRSPSAADINSPPSLFLIGSPSAEKLAQALNAATSVFAAAAGATQKEREFLGKRIYSLPLPAPPAGDTANPAKQALHFAASGGYVVLTTDNAMIEEYLRSNEAAGKPLREMSGLTEAAQQVGGMNSGLFGFENQHETLRVAFETLKEDFGRLQSLLSLPAIRGTLGAAGEAKDLKDWFDISLLPPFERISKYFHFIVYGGGANADGLKWRMFSPTPPMLK